MRRGHSGTVLRIVPVLLLALLAAATGHGPSAGAAESDRNLVRREIIALFDGQDQEDVPDDQRPIWSLLQLPLNHLGLRVRTHDIRLGPPPVAWLPTARAVLTWFRPGLEAPPWLWPWLEKHVPAAKLRVVHFQHLGCLATGAEDRERLQRWLGRFGLEWRAGFVNRRMRIETTLESEATCAMEADPRRYALHQGPANTSKDNRVWVQTRDRSNPTDVRSPVVTGPWGGVALAPWTVRSGLTPGGRRWHLDPFAFLRTALGMERIPAPHPSVLNGRRMFMLHVDGDGFESISTARLNTPAAKVFLDEILDVYRLPATVSIIVASLTKDLRVAEATDSMRLATEILNRPYVEAASHGVLHPYRWAAPWAPGRPPLSTLPYKSLQHYDYSPVAEVRDSVEFINDRLLRDGKRCQVMLWTGDCLPPREAILECARHDCLNLNGGTFRWDDAHSSVGYVSPWVREVGGAVQVCAGAANENEFPGYFTTNPGAFAHIGATIERTGRGRILKPANVYVHFYSAETKPRLDTLKALLERWVRREPTAPVHASAYAAAVISARSVQVHRTKGGWSVRGMGTCPTLRIDDEARHVDFQRSSGVLGARRIGGSLYIHLAAPDAEIRLAPAPPARPHLVEANHAVREGALAERSVALVSQAHVERVLVFGGFPPSSTLKVVRGDVTSKQTADERGRVSLRLPAGGPERVEVRLP